MEPQQKRSHHKVTFTGRLYVITYRAALDVLWELVQFVARLLAAERHPARQQGPGLLLAGGAGGALVPRPRRA